MVLAMAAWLLHVSFLLSHTVPLCVQHGELKEAATAQSSIRGQSDAYFRHAGLIHAHMTHAHPFDFNAVTIHRIETMTEMSSIY